jgi:hypothetical protein
VVLSLFVYAISSIDGSLRVERLETMVLDLLLRTCASNGFGLALLGARNEASGATCASRLRAELRSFDGRGRPSSIG